MSRIGRNDKCWCDSGLKFKHCHLFRATESPIELQDTISSFQRARSKKRCLHPDASKAICSNKIVRSHTVQEALLARIALDGKVYGYKGDLGAIVSSGGVMRPQLIGKSIASTFYGFCKPHDDELFQKIEKHPVVANTECAGLLAYRTLCHELSAKVGCLEFDNHARKLDAGLPDDEHPKIQRKVMGSITGHSTALRELTAEKQFFDSMVKTANFESIRYCVIWFDQIPDIMCSGYMNPQWTFDGEQIQDLADLEVRAESLSCSLICSGDRGCAFFAWLNTNERSCRSLLKSLLRLGPDKIPDAVVRFISSSFENQFMRPSWWNDLGPIRQQALVQRFSDTVNPRQLHPSNYLRYDFRHYVDWTVLAADTNDNYLQSLCNAICNS